MRTFILHRGLQGVLVVAVAAAVLSLAGVDWPAQAQSPGAPSTESASDQLTRGIVLSTEEMAALDAVARGDSDAAYTLLLGLVRDATADAAKAESRDRMASLAEMLWAEIERGGLHARAAKDLAGLAPHAEVVRLMGECARATGDMTLLAWAEQELGFVSGWMVAGPFDNERGAGFSQQYLAEGQAAFSDAASEGVVGVREVTGLPRLGESYAGRAGHPVQWRPVPVAPRMGYVDLNAMMRPDDHVCAYAFTLIEVSEPGPAVLSVASNDGVRVWMNGRELVCATRTSEGELAMSYGTGAHRDFTFDQQEWEVPLARGVNVLMLKVMEEEEAWGFSARVKAGSGTRCATMVPSERVTWEARVPVAMTVVDGDAGRAIAGESVLGDSRSRFWAGLAELYRRRAERKDRVAYRLLSSVRDTLAEAKAGREMAHVLYALSMASASTAETAAGAEENERRDLLLAVLELDARHVPALIDMAAHYTGHLRIPARAEEYARRALEVAPQNVDASMLLARAAADRGLTSEFARISRELLASGRGTSLLHRYLGFMAERTDDQDLAREQYAKALGFDVRDGFSRGKMLREAARAGDVDGYVRLSRVGEALAPFDVSILSERADFLANRGQEVEALTLLRRALEVAPHDDALLENAGRMAQRVAFAVRRNADASGVAMVDGRSAVEVAELHRAEALEFYRLAIERNPTRADLRRHVEFMSEETPAWETALVVDVSERIRFSFAKGYPMDAPAHWLWLDTITKVNADGTSVRHIHAAIKVTNDDGREALRTIPVWAPGEVRVIAGSVHKADGSVVLSKTQDGQVSNPPLAVGDVVEFRWRCADTDKGFFGDYFGDIAPLIPSPPGAAIGGVRGAHSLAADEVRATWLLPKSREFYFHRSHGAREPVTGEVDGMRMVRFMESGIARVEPEPAALPATQWRPTVYVSTFQDWKAFGAWYWNLIERQVRATPAMVTKVAELTAGLESEEAKAKAIYHWVVTAIRYNANWEFGVHGYKPYEAGAIFDRCIGDCKDKAILIVAMLREAGVTAWPVIINAESMRGREDFTLAMPDHFNHAIAVIEFSDGSRRFVDGTATYVGWDEGIPEMDAGARVLVVRPGGGEMVDIPAAVPEKNRDQWEFIVQLKADGSASLTAANAPVGSAASKWRGVLEAEGQRITTMNAMVGELSPGARVATVETSKLSDLSEAVKVGFTAELPKAAQVTANGLSLGLPGSFQINAAWTQTAWGFMATRTTDMGLFEGMGERASWVVMPPAGYTFGEIPAGTTITNPHIGYVQSFERVLEGPLAGGVRVTREWGITAKVVKAADYPAFREALTKIDHANAVKLLMVKG